MGTRAIVDVFDEDDEILVTIYRQMDGYPDGLGMQLRDIIRGVALTNGFSGDQEIPTTFNGMSCFAAFLVGKLKGDTIGSVYLMPAGASDVGEEYRYTVKPTVNGKISVYHKEV